MQWYLEYEPYRVNSRVDVEALVDSITTARPKDSFPGGVYPLEPLFSYLLVDDRHVS